jgi:hypothetical protein
MMRSRFRCYEIESCYIALTVARGAVAEPLPRLWWRRLWDRLLGLWR